jgi:hypothetical protein
MKASLDFCLFLSSLDYPGDVPRSHDHHGD